MSNRPTLMDALRKFQDEGLNGLKGGKRRAAEAQAKNLADWYGGVRPATELTPYHIESFIAGKISGHSSDAAEKVEGLRNFLDYLSVAGYTETNLKKDAKVPRVKGMKRASASREEAVINKFTAEGHADLTHELTERIAHRAEIALSITDARADKDFRENAPLDAAREKQAMNEARIKEIEELLKHSQVINGSGPGKGIDIGSTVVVQRLPDELEQRYTLVHPRETNPGAGKISVESPVGKALLGRSVGEEVSVQAPSGTLVMKIHSVER